MINKDYIANVRIHKKNKDGITYHDVQILDITGRVIAEATHVYGYGVQYKQTTADLLNDRDMLVNLQGQPDFNKWGMDEANRHVLFIVHTY